MKSEGKGIGDRSAKEEGSEKESRKVEGCEEMDVTETCRGDRVATSRKAGSARHLNLSLIHI